MLAGAELCNAVQRRCLHMAVSGNRKTRENMIKRNNKEKENNDKKDEGKA